MARAVILGGSGFIGRWLSKALVKQGFEVHVIDFMEPAEASSWTKADAKDAKGVAALVRPGDVFIHLVHSTVPSESMNQLKNEEKENILPYGKLLDELRGRSPALIVYSSTGGQIYGEAEKIPVPETQELKPITAYGAAKGANEIFTRGAHRKWGASYIILRIGNPYGPFQELTNRHGVVPHLMKSVIHDRPFIVYGGGVTVRDYIYIEDAAEAVAGLVQKKAINTAVNIGTGKGTSLSELIRLVEEITGGRIRTEVEPKRPSDVWKNVLDISLLKELTGFAPRTGLEEGLRRTWEHLKKHEET